MVTFSFCSPDPKEDQIQKGDTMMKKIIVPMLALLLIGLPACAPATPAAAPTTAPAATQPTSAPAAALQLNFWGGWTGPDGDVMREMVKKYNDSHPDVQVTLTTQQWTPLFDKFVISVKSSNQPDVLAMHGPDIPQFAATGVLEPLDDVVAKQGFKAADFAKPAWDGTIYQGKQYAFPLDLHMHGVFYNADMFDKAGVKPPTDWVSAQDFLKIATQLTVDKNGKHPGDSGFDPQNVQQYGLAMYNNHHGFYTFYALLNQQGDHLLNQNQTALDFPQADGANAWQWLQDLVFKYHVVPAGETNPSGDFLAGKTAMLIDGPWQIPAMAKQAGLKWGTFPVPQVFKNKAVWGSGHVLTIPKQSDPKREAAAEAFVAWIVQNSGDWGNSGNLPALNSARDSAAFKALPGRAGFIAEMPYEVMLPAIPAEAQVFSSAATSPIVVVSQAILIQDKPIPASLDTMVQGINGLLK
jgi:multiple sugar transport system substrate-binding protein